MNEEISITHDDPEVLVIARAIADADEGPDNGWDWSMKAASQDNAYHAEPHRRYIAHLITQAVAVKAALEEFHAEV